MKLSEYSKLNNVTYKTAWNRFKAGRIKGARMDETGHVIIENQINSSDNSSVTEWADI